MRTIPRAVATAFVPGLVIRLVILLKTGGLGTPIFDEQDYTRLAASLVHGHGFAWAPAANRPPFGHRSIRIARDVLARRG